MAGGARAISLRSASTSTLVLRASAALLGALAGFCWFWASTSSLESQAVEDGVRDLRWWSASVAGLGIVVALLTWFAATVRGRVGLLVVVGLLAGLTVGAVAFSQFAVPHANPIRPLSFAVPYAIAGFATAGAACLLTALAVAISGGWAASSASTPTPTIGLRAGIVVGLAAAVLVTGAGLLVVDRSQDYLLRVNEYRSVGDLGRDLSRVPASILSGGDRWRIHVPGLSPGRPEITDDGIVLASGQSVIMVDRSTGVTRWRYTRSDVTGLVSVASSGGGTQVLAWWGAGTVYVLDARTGERVGHWPMTAATTSILDPALPVVARTEPDATTRVARLDPDGRETWAYRLGACERARATMAEGVVVLTVMATCGGPSGRLVALDSETGEQLWSNSTAGDVRAVATGAVLVLAPPVGDGTAGSVTAIDLDDGGVRWSQELPWMGNPRLPCRDVEVQAGAQIAAVVCTWDVTDYSTGEEQYASLVQVYDAGTGSTVRTRTYRPAHVVATAVATDGRVLIARADPQQAWVLDVAHPTTARPSLRIAPDAGPHATVRTVTVFGDQVLIVDSGQEILRSLR